MFTGIVQGKGRVAALEPNPFGLRLVIEPPPGGFEGGYTPGLGHSVCVSGVCLTVAALADALEGGRESGGFAFDVIAETLDKTTLGGLAVGDAVNLEPSVTPNQPLGGHFMQGHVDGVGEVTAVHDGDDEWRTTVRPPADLAKYVVPKGSVAIDGVSLTIAAVHDDGAFDVALIPTTLDLTTLRDRRAGSRVNLEADILAKTVVMQLERLLGGAGDGAGAPTAGVTADLLRRAGFSNPAD